MDLSIVIPTFNEAENLRPVLAQIFQVLRDNEIDGEVIIVDDDSPDRTWELAESLVPRYKGLRVVRRRGERGLATAVLCGFKASTSQKMLVMDADLSHPPSLIPKLCEALDEADISVASRNVKGGGVRGWPVIRKAISWGATTIAKLFTDVNDPMSGYFAIKKSVVENVELDPKGYKILLEILVRGRYERVREIPFVFEDRRTGTSKMCSGIITKYVAHAWSLLKVARNTRAQLARFLMVGGLGVLVNLAVLWSLVELGRIDYMVGAAISFVAAVTFNFLGSRAFAFRDEGRFAGHFATQYAKFFAVSAGSLIVNLAALFVLVDLAHVWYIVAQMVAILTATACNFAGNKLWTFRPVPRTKSVALRAVIVGHIHGFEGR